MTDSAPFVIQGADGLRERVGTDLGTSSWVEVTQDRITTFAKLTGDEQWIHVDPEKAKDGPFGCTVQHGFLTLGMSTGLLWEVCVVEGFSVILNYGLNKVRFPAPLKTGSKMRSTTSRVASRPFTDSPTRSRVSPSHAVWLTWFSGTTSRPSGTARRGLVQRCPGAQPARQKSLRVGAGAWPPPGAMPGQETATTGAARGQVTGTRPEEWPAGDHSQDRPKWPSHT
jgi:acyl dehydratase